MQKDEERCLKAGCDGYVPKPISVPHFLDTVEKLINLPNFSTVELPARLKTIN
jgi:two-component system cell cycle response regulator DivK